MAQAEAEQALVNHSVIENVPQRPPKIPHNHNEKGRSSSGLN